MIFTANFLQKLIYRLFRAQRWHVQVFSSLSFCCRYIVVIKRFLVHKGSNVISVVLMAYQSTPFGAISCDPRKWLHKRVMCDMTTPEFCHINIFTAQRRHGGQNAIVLRMLVDVHSTKVPWWTLPFCARHEVYLFDFYGILADVALLWFVFMSFDNVPWLRCVDIKHLCFVKYDNATDVGNTTGFYVN